MNERIAKIRKEAGLTQKEFGARLGGLSQNYIWMIEKGDRVPSDRTIADICREFEVSEEWLRTGTGDMLKPKSRNEELFEFAAKAAEDPNSIQAQFLAVMARLTDEQWEVLDQIARAMAKEIKKSGSDAVSDPLKEELHDDGLNNSKNQ